MLTNVVAWFSEQYVIRFVFQLTEVLSKLFKLYNSVNKTIPHYTMKFTKVDTFNLLI